MHVTSRAQTAQRDFLVKNRRINDEKRLKISQNKSVIFKAFVETRHEGNTEHKSAGLNIMGFNMADVSAAGVDFTGSCLQCFRRSVSGSRKLDRRSL